MQFVRTISLLLFLVATNHLFAQESFINGVINTYTPVLSLNTCNNKITVEDASTFNTGDTVLIIQMKGAGIDSTNTAAFGTITNYNNAGNYEINYVKSKAGNVIELKNILTRQYDIPIGKVQLIRVPYYQNATITSTLTCLPWDGNKGGVLVLNVVDRITLNATINVSGRGFRGGIDPLSTQSTYNCYENDFFYPPNPAISSEKGEGIASISISKSFGKGALSNGGGSGSSHNSGGAGGGNYGNGGQGGYNYEGPPCNTIVPFDNGGRGGKALNYNNTNNKIFLGGGGGAGQTNTGNFQGNGGNGAGIVILMANRLQANSQKIIANGIDAPSCGNTSPDCHEGMGGGGAGGTVLANITTYLDNLQIETRGGKGADMTAVNLDRIGPGGGGGGGLLWLNNSSTPANVSLTAQGGASGVCTDHSNDPWGAAAGQTGANLFNLQIPIDIVVFKPNIDSVRINSTITGCNSIDLRGLGYTNTVTVANWEWFFGDGGTAATQNTSHSYSNPGTYTVKLIVTDINGCKDSIIVNINVVCNSAGIGNIINDYTPILSLNPCENKITVEDAIAFNIGDTVLMIQMKGAVIDSTNTAAFGTVTDYKGAGNYEFNFVKSKTGNIIELKNTIIRQFDIPIGKVQLIRVPYYDDVTVTATLTCLPWDGSKGGVLVLNVADSITLQTNIDVSGRGFRGGTGFNSQTATLNCFENNYFYPQSSNAIAGQKGESITSPSSNINYGKGNAAGGGGGGLGHNSGGGGGGNAGNGGFGGYSLDACGNAPFDNRGIGGRSLAYTTATNKIFAGSGGGAGQADNPGNPAPAGGNGGGISIILANKLITNGNKIISNGTNASTCAIPPSTDCHDAMGGGGAAGTILISVNQLLDNTAVENKGGKGADMVGSVVLGGKIGAGGGGSGGLFFVKQAALPAVITNVNTGGANGVLTQDANNAWGATPGQSGSTLFNLNVPFTTIPFKPNIDSVRIKDSATSCNSYDFKGLGYINTNPVATWQWNFGDGNTSASQNPSHSYATAGSFPVKLIITDINGCRDSITKNVMSSFLTLNAGPADTICITNSTVLQASQTGGNIFAWTPAAFLNDPTLLNPTATPPVTTKFYLTVTNTMGCSSKDSVTIDVRSANGFSITTPPGVCKNDSVQLNASGGDVYSWQPANTLSDPNIANPKAAPATTSAYTVQIIDNLCGFSTSLSTIVTVLPLPIIRTSKSNDITCTIAESKLLATGANTYTWSPGATLNTTTGSSPIARPLATTQYVVSGTNLNGCNNQDSIIVNVTTENPLNYQMPTGFTPNNDGLNDCFGIKYWGNVSEIEFSVFNRWGQRLFYSKKVGDCWNGMHNGLLQDTGVFVYMIKAKTSCDPVVFRKGTFVLIR